MSCLQTDMTRPFNQDLLETRIREINDALQTLQAMLEKRFQELSLVELFAIRYLVIQLVEAAASICIHLIAVRFNERTEGFPDCFIQMGKREIIPNSLAMRLASIGRLRNLLVHRYWTIDDELVYSACKSGLTNFSEYVKCIRDILDKGG